MTNDDIYLSIKKEGIKTCAKGYFTNIEEDHWVVWTKSENIYLLTEDFFNVHSMVAVLKDDGIGGKEVKKWTIKKYTKKELKNKEG